MDVNVKRLDHLGIISGVMHENDFIKMANELLEADKQNIISPGEAIMAMVINGLGFVSRPTTLTPQFFETKPMDLLIGPGIKEESLNRHKLGRVLDAIFEYGCEKFFNHIALQICLNEKIDLSQIGLDTTTFEFEGDYDKQEEDAHVKIAHGYSKARRPDLKQIILELCTSRDGGAPFVMRPWSGNKSDNKIFNERIKALRDASRCSSDGTTLIADSKLYTQDNIKALQNMYFITRVPSIIKLEGEYITKSLENGDWTEPDNGYKYKVYELEHYEVKQRWIVYFSEHAHVRTQKTMGRRIKKVESEIDNAVSAIQKKKFACHDDAMREFNAISKKYKYHNFALDSVTESCKHSASGRPSANAKKTVSHYSITVSYSRNNELINQEIDQRACFVLATSVPESKLASEHVLPRYKELDFTEKGFAFLKTPEFFADAFYLKSSGRIQAMLVIMTLSLLIYMVAQRRMRNTLAEMKKTIPNQINKPTKRPTLRWLFQCLEGIDVVKIIAMAGPIETIITGINNLREFILSCFGDFVIRIYRLDRKREMVT